LKSSPAPTTGLRILFVDDEAPIRMVMENELPVMGHDVTIFDNGTDAITALSEPLFVVAIIELRMPGISGWQVVEQLIKQAPETDFIISSGHGDVGDVRDAFNQGSFDYLPKPVELPELANTLQRLAKKRSLVNRTVALEQELVAVRGKTEIVGESPQMEKVKTIISRIAPTDSSVLILGETGTGKELVARSVHELSDRSKQPFVAVNCGALPENLVESELFGHKKGAFTGADTPRKGLIEVANGGTLFLDELGELDKTMQVKMLRFLESGEVRRVGENEAFNVDVRIVCATNRNLQEMVHEGTFREDLFFRINTFEVQLPPLRDRKDDIPDLARTLVARHLKKSSVRNDILAPETIAMLRRHEWSGNVRELANAVEHACILSGGDTILPEHLPRAVSLHAGDDRPFHVTNFHRPLSLREIEQEVIEQTLDKNEGDKPRTADELGIALKTLYNKLNQYAVHDSSVAG